MQIILYAVYPAMLNTAANFKIYRTQELENRLMSVNEVINFIPSD